MSFGGIAPAKRCRRAGALTPAEREEISRGLASEDSLLAFLGHAGGDGFAEAVGAAGNDGNFAVKTGHGWSIPRSRGVLDLGVEQVAEVPVDLGHVRGSYPEQREVSADVLDDA